MRIKARPGLHYAPVPGGVYFAGPRTQFVMRGWDLLFTVADVCVPLLEDGATEDDLVTALGSEQARPAVRHLTDRLRTHGLLLEPDRLTVPEPPASVRERHPESLALLESVCTEPYAAFAALKAVTVALAGPPEAVGPAARGLIRSGAGRVIVLDRDGDRSLPADADAVLRCIGADDELGLPPSDGRQVAVVPVLLDDRLLLAGPVVRDSTGLRTWSTLRTRALSWSESAGASAAGPPRPVADALAGSLAAQLLFEVVTGVAGDDEAHVVHGPDLAADRITVRHAERPGPAWRWLTDIEPARTPEPEETVDLVSTVSQPWTGLLERIPGDTLPQMPLALREAEYRAGRSGSVVAWGANQQSAVVAVALAALRQSVSDAPEVAGRAVGAAGLTEGGWLLDGALRLLTEHTRPLRVVSEHDLDPEALRYWSELHRTEPARYTVQLRHAPGLDWVLCRVESAGTGPALGLAWGPDADTAVQHALGTALARAQVRTVTGAGERVPLLNTDALSGAADDTITALCKQVCALRTADTVGYRGYRAGADPVLGELALWFGPVELGPAKQEPSDAH
jgi:hypothetical protein